METFSAPLPEEIALQHERKICNVVAERFGFDVAELTLIERETFRMDDGSYAFFIRHKTGMYGVNAQVSSNGDLDNMTVANLQADEFRKNG